MASVSKSTGPSATSYEHGSTEQRLIGMKLIDQLNIEKGMTVLDLGCGTGYLTKVLSECVGVEGKVVAVDPDIERLSIAKKLYSAGNIEYILADDKSFPTNHYDIIYCNVVIHWIHDKVALFRRVFDNLRQGGCFSFTTYDTPVFPPIVEKLFTVLVGPDFLHKMLHEKQVYITSSEYNTIISRLGFSSAQIETESIVTEWKDIDEFLVTAHGVLQGEFDPQTIDKDALQRIKEECGGDSTIKRQFELIKAVVIK